MQNITSDDLAFLQQIRYFFNIGGNGADSCFSGGHFANLYNNGAPYNGAPWGFVPLPGGSDKVVKIIWTWTNQSANSTSIQYITDLELQTESNQGITWRFYEPVLNVDDMTESMVWYQPGGSGHGNNWTFYICDSPYYFEMYNGTCTANDLV